MEVSKYVRIFSQDQVRQRGRSRETNAGRWWRWFRGKGVLVVRLHNCFDSWVGCAVDDPKWGSTNQRALLGTFKTNRIILTNWIFVITMTRPSKSPVELHFSQSSYNASIYSWSCPTLAIEFAFGYTFLGFASPFLGSNKSKEQRFKRTMCSLPLLSVLMLSVKQGDWYSWKGAPSKIFQNQFSSHYTGH